MYHNRYKNAHNTEIFLKVLNGFLHSLALCTSKLQCLNKQQNSIIQILKLHDWWRWELSHFNIIPYDNSWRSENIKKKIHQYVFHFRLLWNSGYKCRLLVVQIAQTLYISECRFRMCHIHGHWSIQTNFSLSLSLTGI